MGKQGIIFSVSAFPVIFQNYIIPFLRRYKIFPLPLARFSSAICISQYIVFVIDCFKSFVNRCLFLCLFLLCMIIFLLYLTSSNNPQLLSFFSRDYIFGKIMTHITLNRTLQWFFPLKNPMRLTCCPGLKHPFSNPVTSRSSILYQCQKWVCVVRHCRTWTVKFLYVFSLSRTRVCVYYIKKQKEKTWILNEAAKEDDAARDVSWWSCQSNPPSCTVKEDGRTKKTVGGEERERELNGCTITRNGRYLIPVTTSAAWTLTPHQWPAYCCF